MYRSYLSSRARSSSSHPPRGEDLPARTANVRPLPSVCGGLAHSPVVELRDSDTMLPQLAARASAAAAALNPASCNRLVVASSALSSARAPGSLWAAAVAAAGPARGFAAPATQLSGTAKAKLEKEKRKKKAKAKNITVKVRRAAALSPPCAVWSLRRPPRSLTVPRCHSAAGTLRSLGSSRCLASARPPARLAGAPWAHIPPRRGAAAGARVRHRRV